MRAIGLWPAEYAGVSHILDPHGMQPDLVIYFFLFSAEQSGLRLLRGEVAPYRQVSAPPRIGLRMGLVTTSVICLLTGAALALRFNFLILLPATIITLLLSCAIMIRMQFSVWQITISALAEMTALQAGYVAGALLRHGLVRRRSRIKGDAVKHVEPLPQGQASTASSPDTPMNRSAPAPH